MHMTDAASAGDTPAVTDLDSIIAHAITA